MKHDSTRLPSKQMYDVYLIGDGLPQARQRWVKVGIAFENQDASLTIILDALPLNGKLQLRERERGRLQVEAK